MLDPRSTRASFRFPLRVELIPGEVASQERSAAVAASSEAELLRLDSEFGSYVPGEYRTPRVMLLPAGDPTYFPPGIKHRYARPNR